MREAMLSTVDNPYNPFDNFEAWFAYDCAHGYNSCGIMASNTYTSEDYGEERILEDIEQGINDFLENDILGLYCKVVRDTDIPIDEVEE